MGCHHSATSARRRGRGRSNRTTDQSTPLQGEGWVGMGFPTAQASGKRGANAMEAQGNTRIRKEQRQRKLRRNPTDTERELWQSLRGKQLDGAKFRRQHPFRSEEHTSELQSLMRSSYAVSCLKNNIQMSQN